MPAISALNHLALPSVPLSQSFLSTHQPRKHAIGVHLSAWIASLSPSFLTKTPSGMWVVAGSIESASQRPRLSVLLSHCSFVFCPFCLPGYLMQVSLFNFDGWRGSRLCVVTVLAGFEDQGLLPCISLLRAAKQHAGMKQ